MSYAPFYKKSPWVFFKEYDEYHKALKSGMLYSKEDWKGYYECQADYERELAYERHLENRGWEEAELQDKMEQERGVIQFSDAIKRGFKMDANLRQEIIESVERMNKYDCEDVAITFKLDSGTKAHILRNALADEDIAEYVLMY